MFLDTRTDSTFSRYSPGFCHFLILTQIRPFSITRRERFSILARILPFPDTHPDSTIFGHSIKFDHFPVLTGTVFNTRGDSTYSWYSPGFYHFSVPTKIRPFSDTRLDSFSILAWILPFLVLAWNFFRYSHRFYLFPILARILPFPSTRPDSTIFWYSHRFDPFLVLAGTIFRYS